MLLLASLLVHSLEVLEVANDSPCGHVISTIRLGSIIEVHTEIDKQCVSSFHSALNAR